MLFLQGYYNNEVIINTKINVTILMKPSHPAFKA